MAQLPLAYLESTKETQKNKFKFVDKSEQNTINITDNKYHWHYHSKKKKSTINIGNESIIITVINTKGLLI